MFVMPVSAFAPEALGKFIAMPQSGTEKQDRRARKRRGRIIVWGGLAAVAGLVSGILVLLQ
jgi:hypothetical protein